MNTIAGTWNKTQHLNHAPYAHAAPARPHHVRHAPHCCCHHGPPQAAEAAELKKFEETKRRALDQKAVQTQQLEELKGRILAERAESKREGELLRARAVQEAEDMKAKERARVEKARQLNADTKEANKTLQVRAAWRAGCWGHAVVRACCRWSGIEQSRPQLGGVGVGRRCRRVLQRPHQASRRRLRSACSHAGSNSHPSHPQTTAGVQAQGAGARARAGGGHRGVRA